MKIIIAQDYVTQPTEEFLKAHRIFLKVIRNRKHGLKQTYQQIVDKIKTKFKFDIDPSTIQGFYTGKHGARELDAFYLKTIVAVILAVSAYRQDLEELLKNKDSELNSLRDQIVEETSKKDASL